MTEPSGQTQKTALETLLAALKADGVANEQLVAVAEQISKASAAKFYTELLANLTQEEVKAVNDLPSQEEADARIKELFFQKTGKSADQVKGEIIADLAKAYLKEYQDKKASPPQAQAT